MPEINDDEFYRMLTSAMFKTFTSDPRPTTNAQNELLFQLDRIVFDWLSRDKSGETK